MTNQAAHIVIVTLCEIGCSIHQSVLSLSFGLSSQLAILLLTAVLILSIITPLSLMLYCDFSEVEATLKLTKHIQVSLSGKRE